MFTDFFGRLFDITHGTFRVEPLAVLPGGSELVVAHLRISMTINGMSRSGDGVVVYRVIDGLIVEAFDIPSRALLDG